MAAGDRPRLPTAADREQKPLTDAEYNAKVRAELKRLAAGGDIDFDLAMRARHKGLGVSRG